MTRIALASLSLLLASTAAAAAAEGDCLDAKSPALQGAVVYVGTAEDGFLGAMQVKPGDRRTLRLWVRRGPSWEAPKACVRWHLDTPGLATLDEKTGALVVAADAQHDATIRVRASLARGGSDLSGELRVFRPEESPLTGTWREAGQLDCRGRPATPDEPIAELELRADGGFSVTWHPFESYRDYWGTYRYDLAKGTVEFTTTGGNYRPPDFHGEGRFHKEPGGRLKLDGVWLGNKREGAPRGCGHVFEPR